MSPMELFLMLNQYFRSRNELARYPGWSDVDCLHIVNLPAAEWDIIEELCELLTKPSSKS